MAAPTEPRTSLMGTQLVSFNTPVPSQLVERVICVRKSSRRLG